MMATRRVYDDAQQVLLATELIRLGARLQLLESETSLSRERLIKLYKQQRGTSPPKGMLPFSTDWFISWQPNIHASVFLTIHQYLIAHADVSAIQAITKAYALYLEQLPPLPSEPAVLSLTPCVDAGEIFREPYAVTTTLPNLPWPVRIPRISAHSQSAMRLMSSARTRRQAQASISTNCAGCSTRYRN